MTCAVKCRVQYFTLGRLLRRFNNSPNPSPSRSIFPPRYFRRPLFQIKILILSAACILGGCGDMYLDAPHGATVMLMSEEQNAKVHVEQVVWFKYWGNEPFSEAETHAATIIQKQHLKWARIRMVNTFADGVISTFTGPFGFPRRTLIVEGNP